MNNYIRRFLKNNVYHCVSFAIIMTVINMWLADDSFLRSFALALVIGCILTVFHIFCESEISAPEYLLNKISPHLNMHETIRFYTPVNYISGEEPINGKLFLTDERLIFESIKHNKKVLSISYNLAEIKAVETFKPLKLFTNGLAIHTHSNKTENFVVKKPKQWVSRFNHIRA